MKRLFLTEWDLSDWNPLFLYREKVGFVLSSKGIEFHTKAGSWNELYQKCRAALPHARIPDLCEGFSTVLSDQEELRQERFDQKRPIILQATQRFQGQDAIQSFQKTWIQEALATFAFSHPEWAPFLREPDQRDLVYSLLERFSEIPYFLNSKNPELEKALMNSLRKKKLLLHVCCGPDAAGVISQLNRDFDLHMFWYDPNIQPYEEYLARLQAFEKVAKIEGISYTVGEYDVERFLERIEGLEYSAEKGAKCSVCYDLRLERAAFEAAEKGFDLYATTLAISPHKVQEKLKNFGRLYADKYQVMYLARNFMKDEKFKDSVRYSREHEIYRQDYCGCYFSLWEGGASAQEKARDWNFLPPNKDEGSYL